MAKEDKGITEQIRPVEAGELPPYEVAELPAPPPFGLKGILEVIGPGAIILGASIGSGEWLVGPAATVKYGVELIWITTVASILQGLFNMEAIRYTLYTGEPIYTGFMRLKPGKFWGVFYTILGFFQIGWPGWALSAATALAAIALGRAPGKEDSGTVLFWGYVTFFIVIITLAVGGKIEKTLEKVSWFFLFMIFAFLLAVNLLVAAPRAQLGETFLSLFKFGTIPPGADWVLLGAFAAYSAAGGVINCAITNWFRDKGFGMGGVVGFIPGAVGGRRINLSPFGKIFRITPENLRKWNDWWKYATTDQWVIFVGGSLMGMFLTINMATALIPRGTEIGGWSVANFQAVELAKIGGKILWILTALNGFWILFSTQLSVSDGYIRQSTDALWVSDRVRRWCRGDVRILYYALLALFTLWGCIAINLAQPFILILIGANTAGLVFVIASIHILLVNRKLLPKELRPPLWREIGVLFCALFYGFFVTMLAGRQAGLW
ncbi:MAG TPA: Nramp family divalent metal transporter [Candidatus Limnocylindrales bacterium]|nr:Nramp family divalent metal transporter [Candidatus Limnocylindrales bacterium]